MVQRTRSEIKPESCNLSSSYSDGIIHEDKFGDSKGIYLKVMK